MLFYTRLRHPTASASLLTGLTLGTSMPPKKTPARPAAAAPAAPAPAAAAAPSPTPNAQFQDAIDAFKVFNPKTTRWSELNALALAHASNLAYQDEATIRSVAPSCGFNNVSVRSVREVQALVAGSEDAVVVAFRGTRPDQLLDWMTDIDAEQVSFSDYFKGPSVGNTHRGFTVGLLRVWDLILADVAAFQDKAQTLWITGHSLGGALAALAAAAFNLAKRVPVNGLYTYGQPRVGDLNFIAQCDSHLGSLHFRLVNDEDIVTRVPPRLFPHLPSPIPWFYGHSGQVLYFDGQGVLHSDEHWWNEFLIRFDVGADHMRDLLTAQVADHDLIKGYAANIVKYRDDVAADRIKPLQF
jgi:triacylglycerol lipase